ncbi:hypothetical protein KVG29_09170 [Caldicoprobacter algeriensis]|uniref:hypothetical protein n=1 Tax=Caldicoprobacter algeriensis TaxID=699281 RepID=UPI0020797A37|nr:hypothetical protein [Caldicoprobacter algeriensis]MCM8901390.1 hypothetical protein [Caldicoprobacter algeriensis]
MTRALSSAVTKQLEPDERRAVQSWLDAEMLKNVLKFTFSMCYTVVVIKGL